MGDKFNEKLDYIYQTLKNNPGPQVPVTLSVPIDPEFLNRQMQAASPRLAGGLRIPNYRLAFLVSAGETVEVPFPLPKGFTCTRRSPLHFDSDYYHEDLTVDVSVDGVKINPYAMPLTASFEVDFGTYYIKRERVDITFTNDTNTDATVSFQVIAHLMTDDIYASWYAPLVDSAQELLTTLAKAGR